MYNSLIPYIPTILILGLAIYMKSFIKKKAENFATKKDIGEITTIVEEIRKQYNSELEFLRSKLSLYEQSFNSIKSFERNALIEISNKYSAWLHSLLNFNLIFYSYDFYEPLLQLPFNVLQKHLEFDIAEDNLHLYVHDMQIINKALELKLATFELEGSLFKSLSLFITNCKLYNQKIELAEKMGLDRLEQVHAEYIEKQEPVIDRSMQEKVTIANKINAPHIEFIKVLNHRIYQLIQVNTNSL
ncbi:MAG TPA: hypothetical protein VFI29_19935 [Hanamia sp.]|nr:hypothetical protein [Hanamia sp.]